MSPTLTDTDPFVELVELYDKSVPCHMEACGAGARWAWRCPCGCEWHHCGEHAVMLRRNQQSNVRILCQDCKAIAPTPIPYRPL